MLLTFAKGMGTGAGLIVAIGAQNAFVLSQGVRKNHYLVIPAVCAVCDAVLVCLGVTGAGALITGNPLLSKAAGIGGALFLFAYGALAFRSAVLGGRLDTDSAGLTSTRAAVLATLAVTLLNPHVYIDTVILMGSLSSQFQAPGHLVFGAGAVTASFIWFFLLSIGAGFLAPLFKKPGAWRCLDTFVGMVMWGIGISITRGIIIW